MDYEQITTLSHTLGSLSTLILAAMIARHTWRKWLQACDRLIIGVSLLSSRKRYELEVAERLRRYV